MIILCVREHIYPCSRSRGSAAPAAPPPPRQNYLRVRDDAQTQWRIRVNQSQWGLGLKPVLKVVFTIFKIMRKQVMFAFNN
jgi:hypothetical protein